MIILYSIIGTWFLFYLTWVYYIAFMTIKKNFKNLDIKDKIGLTPHFIFGYFIDIVLQITFGIAAFHEVPKEWTLSGRVNRHQDESTGWQLARANHLCHKYLKPYDETHCK